MRFGFVSVSLAMFAAGAIGAAAPVQTTPPKAPAMLHVEKTTVRAGDVKPGTTVEATFHFKNTGKRPVKILRAAPS